MIYHIKTNTNTHKQLSRQDNDVFHFFRLNCEIKKTGGIFIQDDISYCEFWIYCMCVWVY